MMLKHINFNGNLYPENELNLGLNRAMRYGDGVFETIRVMSGELLWWPEHFKRLELGLKQLSMKIPDLFFDELLVDCLATLHRNNITKGGILRIITYRKGGPGYTPTNYDFDYLIETENLEGNLFKLNKKGIRIDISKSVVLPIENKSVKTLNKIPYIIASSEKVNRGFDELIITNTDNFLVEACSSNLFLIIKDELFTPKLEDGCLDGITRNKVIEAAKNMGMRVKAINLISRNLEVADEIFLTNSIVGIKWVGAYKKQRYFHNISSKLLELLNKTPD